MRWNLPEHRDTRTRTFFALLPIRVKNEVRWLERVTVEEQYDAYLYEWIVQQFVDK